MARAAPAGLRGRLRKAAQPTANAVAASGISHQARVCTEPEYVLTASCAPGGVADPGCDVREAWPPGLVGPPTSSIGAPRYPRGQLAARPYGSVNGGSTAKWTPIHRVCG